MAAENFARALALVLVHEGGKSDDPHDPGGRTNWGITHFDYDAYRKSKGLPLRDVYLMDDSERDEIYRTQYWNAVCGDELPSGLDYVLFDGGVNSGVGQSIKWLQRALPYLPVNGRLAAELLSAVSQVADVPTLISELCAARREFLQNLSTFQYFGRGWMRRVDDLEATATAWAMGAESPPPPPASTTSDPKALRESATPLPSTAPGDALTAASAAGIVASAAAHGLTSTPAATAPSATATIVASTPTASPSAPSTSAPVQPVAPTSTQIAQTATPPAATGPAPATTPAATTAAVNPLAPPQPAKPVPLATSATASATTTTNPLATPQQAKPTAPSIFSAPATTRGATPSVLANAAPSVPTPAKPVATVVAPPAVNPSTPSSPSAATHALAPTIATKPAVSATQVVATAKPVSPPTTETKPIVAIPVATPSFSLTDYEFPAVLVVLGLLFALGAYLSIASRQARARRVDALGDNPVPTTPLKAGKLVSPLPKPVPAARATKAPAPPQLPSPTAAPAMPGEPSVPLVQNVYARALSIAWIAVTIGVNVIALAKLLQYFGFARENWHQPFYMLGNLYDTYAGQAFNATSASVSQQFHFALPIWLMPLFVLYVSMASAFVVASSGLMKRNTTAESFFGAVIHAGWILAVPAFVMDAVRFHVVTRFARQNTVLFFAYMAAFIVCYVAARFINDDFLVNVNPVTFSPR